MSRRAIKLINWAAIAERVPEIQRPLFNAFKAKSEQYLQRMQANPESSPKINWDYYRKALVTPVLADKFQKEYESFKIPFPADKYTSQIEALEKITDEAIEKFRVECEKESRTYYATIAAWEAIMPYDQMTIEDFLDAHPEYELGTTKSPSVWPHTDAVTEAEEAARRGENGDH